MEHHQVKSHDSLSPGRSEGTGTDRQGRVQGVSAPAARAAHFLSCLEPRVRQTDRPRLEHQAGTFAGFVTQFEIEQAHAEQFEVHVVGSARTPSYQ